MKGIYNLGNTCYFNSTLQCLLQIPQLSNYFILKGYSGECEFTKEYQNVVKEMWINKKEINPQKLLKIFRSKYSQFDNGEQHDSQEAFLCILDILEKSLTNFIKDVFYGVNIQETICKSGKSVKKEDFNVIMLFPKEDENNIVDIIKSSQKWNGIKDYEDHNKKIWPVAATRTLPEKLPIILVFSFKMYGSKKKIELVDELEINNQKYTLFATSNHQGSTRGGHYVAFTKHKGHWCLKDDAMTHNNINFPFNDYHYLVFYKKNVE